MADDSGSGKLDFALISKSLEIAESLARQLHSEREKNKELEKKIAELTTFKNIVACCFELFLLDARMATRIKRFDDEG